MLLEMFWILSGAFGFGGAFVFLFDRAFGVSLFSLLSLERYWVLAVFVMGGVIFFFLWAARSPSFASFLRLVLPGVRVVAVQFVIWVCFGSAFSLIVVSSIGWGTTSFYVIGLYALAYGAGFLAIFAPAGVGVREAVLVLGLAGRMSTEEALVFAALHRMLYLFADFLLAGISCVWIWGAKRRKSIKVRIV